MAEQKPSPDDSDLPEAERDDLVAYLDGELDPKAAAAMAAKLSLDPKLRAKAEAYQRTWDILDVLPKPEPSPTFATRTLSQVMPLTSGQLTLPQTSLAMTAMTPRRSGVPFWAISGVAVLTALAAGYLGHLAFAPAPKTVSDPPLEDVPLMKNMRLYRNVDDMEYLKRLDSPELFGDESE